MSIKGTNTEILSWNAHKKAGKYLCPFEVGSHGFIGNSLIQFLTKVGLSVGERKEIQHKASEAACRGSA